MSLDPGENFGKKKLLQRQTRQACPGKTITITLVMTWIPILEGALATLVSTPSTS